MAVKIGELVVNMSGNIARLQQDMADAKGVVSGAAGEITNTIGTIKSAFASIAGALAVDAMVAFFDKIASGLAAMQHMSEVSGVAVTALAEFRSVAKLTGTDMESVNGALVKLSKNMVEAQDPASKAGQAFAAIGVDVKNMDGSLKSADQVFKDMALSLAQFEDGAAKTAVMTDTLGKAGAQLGPLMKDLADQQKRVADMTDEQRAAYQANLEWIAKSAQAADTYEKNLKSLQGQSDAWKSAIVLGMIPALNDAITAFKLTTDGAGGLTDQIKALARDGTIKDWTAYGINAISYLADAFAGLSNVITSLGLTMGAMVAGAGAALNGLLEYQKNLLSGNLKGAWDSLTTAVSQQKTIQGQLADDLSKTWAAETFGQKLRDNLDKVRDGSTEAAGDQNKGLKKLQYGATDAAAAIDPLQAAFDSLVDSLGKGKAEKDAQIKFMNDFGTATEATKSAVVAYEIEQGKLQGLTDAQKTQLTDMAAKLDEQTTTYNAMKTGLHNWKTEVENALKAADDWQKKQDDIHLKKAQYVDAYNDANTALSDQINLLGSTSLAIDTYNTKKAAEKDIQDMLNLGLDHEAQRMQEALNARLALIQQKYETQERIDFWNTVATKAGEFGRALLDGPGAAFTYLKNLAKDLLAQLIEMFAKKFVLQIAASVTGLGSLEALAGGVGQGTTAGSLLSGAGGLFGSLMNSAGSLIASIGGGVAEGFGAFLSNIGSTGLLKALSSGVTDAFALAGLGDVAGAIGAALGPIGLAVSAIAAIASLFGDAGENPKLQLGFGGNAQAYDWAGVFGKEGFFTIQTNDAFNKGLAGALKQIGDAFDPAIKSFLSPDKFDSVVATLNSTIAREFAFPKGDNTAGEQVTVDYLKTKYGIIFDALDPVFAQKVHDWSGTAEDLAKAIGNEIAQLQAVKTAVETVTAAMGLVPPSSFEAQQALVAAAGGIQQFTGQASFYLQNFYSDSERAAQALDGARKTVTDGFAALGLAVPANKAAFRDLVNSIDLNSASGPKLYSALMALAPAFSTVASASDAAAAAMLGRWAQVQQAIGAPASTTSGLDSLLGQFRQGHSWAGGGQYADNAFLVNQLSMIQQSDFAGYSEADQALIVSILQAAHAAGMIGGTTNTTTPTTDTTTPTIGQTVDQSSGNSGGGNYGLTISSTLGAAEWSEAVKIGMKQALAEAGVTQDTAKNDARYDELRANTHFIADMAGQIAERVIADLPATSENTRRTAAAAEQLVANGDRRL